MSRLHEAFVAQFLTLATEELVELEADVTPENLHQIIKSWCEVYDEVPPRNRAEIAVRDALEECREQLAITIRHSVPQNA